MTRAIAFLRTTAWLLRAGMRTRSALRVAWWESKQHG